MEKVIAHPKVVRGVSIWCSGVEEASVSAKFGSKTRFLALGTHKLCFWTKNKFEKHLSPEKKIWGKTFFCQKHVFWPWEPIK